MKKEKLKKILSTFLCMAMLFGSSSMTAFAEGNGAKGDIPQETTTVDYSKQQSEGVTYDRYDYDDASDTYTFYYTINENAGSDIVIDLSKCALEMWENDTQMPGCHYKFRISIENKSGKTYRYKDGSFVLAPGDSSDYGSLEEGSLLPVLTYDGQYMPIRFSGAIWPNYFKDVFGVTSDTQITFEMMCQIYDYLEKKGYTGETAISNYILNYYNNKKGSNYESLTKLFEEHPEWLESNMASNNGIWTMSESELNGYVAKYPWVDKFLYVKGSGDNLSVQIKWPEPALAAASYNIFYKEFFSVVYGKDNVEKLNPNGSGVEFSRSHGVGDYMNGSDRNKEANAYFKNLIGNEFKSGDTREVWTGYGLDGPGIGNPYANYEFLYYNIIELEEVEPIKMSLSDITIYTGGNGYKGVVDGTEGNLSGENGFPTPGFYITLPDELNNKLGKIENLANIMKLKYDDGNGTVREWNLDLYGTQEHSTDKDGYVYKFELSGSNTDQIRMQLKTPDGKYITSDDFDVSLNQQNKEYEMDVYNGSFDAKYVSAEIKVGDKTYTYPVEKGNAAKLIVRANINEKHADVVNSKDKIDSGDFAAVAKDDTTYYVNDKNVQVEDTTGVKLMVDDVIDHEVLVNHLKENSNVSLPKGDVKFEQKYMDLVDTNNGDTYLTLGEGHEVTVYWPVPKDYNEKGDAYIYHFDGVDRDYNTGNVIENIDNLIPIKPELVTLNGTKYFEFNTSSFSPFVLAYSNGTDSNGTNQNANGNPNTAVKTGDTTNVLFWSMIAVLSLAGVITVLKFRYRKNK